MIIINYKQSQNYFSSDEVTASARERLQSESLRIIADP